jgi:hypothetical protein
MGMGSNGEMTYPHGAVLTRGEASSLILVRNDGVCILVVLLGELLPD